MCQKSLSLRIQFRSYEPGIFDPPPPNKYPTLDNPNKVGLTFNPKKQLPQVERKQIFTLSLKTHKTHRKL